MAMNIISVSVDFRDKYVGEPLVTLEVDAINMPFSFEKHPINPDETIFVGTHASHPFVRVYGHNAKNEGGSGGEELKFMDKNGQELKVKGPWDLNVFMVNGMIGTDYLPIKVKSEHSTRIVCISANDLKNIFAQHNTDMEVITYGQENGDILFSVKELGKRPKNDEIAWEKY